jgi:hypothetical protein
MKAEGRMSNLESFVDKFAVQESLEFAFPGIFEKKR